jgi:hypothetical protein
MSQRKSFKEYNSSPELLAESSWLSKGFAIGQRNRHIATRQKLESLASKIISDSNLGKNEKEIASKLNHLFELTSEIGKAFRLLGELSSNVLNVSVATNLLEIDSSSKSRKR